MQNKCSHQISIWFIRIVFSHNFYGHTPLECYLLLVIHFGWAKCPNGSSNKKKNLFRKNICFFSRATLYQRNAWLEWLCMIRACIVELIFMFSNNSERFHIEYVRFNSLTWFSIRLPAGYLSKCKWFLLNARCHICRLLNCWEQTATTNFGSVRNSTSFFILVFFLQWTRFGSDKITSDSDWCLCLCEVYTEIKIYLCVCVKRVAWHGCVYYVR